MKLPHETHVHVPPMLRRPYPLPAVLHGKQNSHACYPHHATLHPAPPLHTKRAASFHVLHDRPRMAARCWLSGAAPPHLPRLSIKPAQPNRAALKEILQKMLLRASQVLLRLASRPASLQACSTPWTASFIQVVWCGRAARAICQPPACSTLRPAHRGRGCSASLPDWQWLSARMHELGQAVRRDHHHHHAYVAPASPPPPAPPPLPAALAY